MEDGGWRLKERWVLRQEVHHVEVPGGVGSRAGVGVGAARWLIEREPSGVVRPKAAPFAWGPLPWTSGLGPLPARSLLGSSGSPWLLRLLPSPFRVYARPYFSPYCHPCFYGVRVASSKGVARGWHVSGRVVVLRVKVHVLWYTLRVLQNFKLKYLVAT